VRRPRAGRPRTRVVCGSRSCCAATTCDGVQAVLNTPGPPRSSRARRGGAYSTSSRRLRLTPPRCSSPSNLTLVTGTMGDIAKSAAAGRPVQFQCPLLLPTGGQCTWRRDKTNFSDFADHFSSVHPADLATMASTPGLWTMKGGFIFVCTCAAHGGFKVARSDSRHKACSPRFAYPDNAPSTGAPAHQPAGSASAAATAAAEAPGPAGARVQGASPAPAAAAPQSASAAFSASAAALPAPVTTLVQAAMAAVAPAAPAALVPVTSQAALAGSKRVRDELPAPTGPDMRTFGLALLDGCPANHKTLLE
jgi:hypothetical protein